MWACTRPRVDRVPRTGGPSGVHHEARAETRAANGANLTSPKTFADLGVPTDMAAALDAAGITSPFPIQALTLGDALAGRDICGKAPTGSGKTLAFALPVAVRTPRATPGRPTALILTPTRELAAQVRKTLLPIAAVRGLRVATFYGGTNIKRDLQDLRKGVDVAVATPGRLADLVRRGDIRLDRVQLAVLDEADRMADMGFLPEVTRLLDQVPSDRQTLLFSATLDGDVDVLIRRFQVDPRKFELDTPAEAAGDVHHVFWSTTRETRRDVTTDALKRAGQAIVFTRTKRGADRLAKQLRAAGVRTEAIHGDRSQNQRERALASFSRGSVTTLVATDVAARGIHVDDVALVLHYDVPASDKDYVHRSGRTGRAGATGVVVSLVLDDDHSTIAGFQRSLDLPVGLHEVDLGHLDADTQPHPTITLRGGAPARPAGKGGGSSSRGKAKGGGSGGHRRGRSTGNGGGRAQASRSRGKGGARVRARSTEG